MAWREDNQRKPNGTQLMNTEPALVWVLAARELTLSPFAITKTLLWPAIVRFAWFGILALRSGLVAVGSPLIVAGSDALNRSVLRRVGQIRKQRVACDVIAVFDAMGGDLVNAEARLRSVFEKTQNKRPRFALGRVRSFRFPGCPNLCEARGRHITKIKTKGALKTTQLPVDPGQLGSEFRPSFL
jgi:hypothetical protein